MNRFQRWWHYSDGAMWLIIGGLVAFGVVLIGLLIASDIEDRKRWAAYSAAHACKLVGETDGDTAVGFAGGKVVTTVSAGKRGYLCDDGVTYWRSK